MLSLFVILILSYLAGSIPASLWISRHFFHVDIRNYGSGNVGATNAFRILGWKAGVLTTLVDAGKGVLAAGLIASIRLDGYRLDSGLGRLKRLFGFLRALPRLRATCIRSWPVSRVEKA